LITVGEYIRQLQPDIFQFLCQKFNIICAKDITQQIIAAVNIVERDKHARIMQERPKPGRGGLLPGEGEDALK